MKVKFTISSNISFFQKTYEVLVKSLINSGVPKKDIYFFVGGASTFEKIEKEINFYFVNHNSIDFTGLISVLELQEKSDYWFLLHDTSYVGPSFYQKIKAFTYDTDVVRLSPHVSMNIGAYKQEYLESIKDRLLEFKNTDYSIESINYFKNKCVENEDCFFKTTKSNFYTSNHTVEGPVDFYKNGVPRIIEHYNEIDLHKVKANWVGKSRYELNL